MILVRNFPELARSKYFDFDHDLGLDGLCTTALCISYHSLAMIVDSSKCIKDPITLFPVVGIVVVVMVIYGYKTFWHEPGLTIYYFVVIFLTLVQKQGLTWKNTIIESSSIASVCRSIKDTITCMVAQVSDSAIIKAYRLIYKDATQSNLPCKEHGWFKEIVEIDTILLGKYFALLVSYNYSEIFFLNMFY